MKNTITFTVERRFLMLLNILFWVSIMANVSLFGMFVDPSYNFVPTYHEVKTIYDRAQDDYYKKGYLMTDFEVYTDALFPEGEHKMDLKTTEGIAFNPDVWCMDGNLLNKEMLIERCEKYWNK